jgi:putative hydrolase of HD superfamily
VPPRAIFYTSIVVDATYLIAGLIITAAAIFSGQVTMSHPRLLRWFFELGHLGRVKREGWRMLGLETPESIADHSLRAAQIGFALSNIQQKGDPFRVAVMLMFHDVAECRVGDIHRLGDRYVTALEEQAVIDQCAELGDVGAAVRELWEEYERRESTESQLAKDADLLEMAVRSRELIDIGFTKAAHWLDSAEEGLTSDLAKELVKALRSDGVSAWWENLKV